MSVRERFREDLLPDALAIGLTEDEFWKLNPRKWRIHIIGYEKRMKMELEQANTIAYLQGRYIVDALLCTVGNMFSKNAKNTYPDKPYELGDKRKTVEEMSEDEIIAQQNLIFAGLEVAMSNFKHKGE